MTTRTYHTEDERVRALEAAMDEYRRTGVYRAPMPAALAAHEATRYRRLDAGIAPRQAGATAQELAEALQDGRTLLAAPPPDGATAEQVAQVIVEAVEVFGDQAAQGLVATALHRLGASDDQVIDAMRRVQAERDRLAMLGQADPAQRRPESQLVW
jgi:hypothetical protein